MFILKSIGFLEDEKLVWFLCWENSIIVEGNNFWDKVLGVMSF